MNDFSFSYFSFSYFSSLLKLHEHEKCCLNGCILYIYTFFQLMFILSQIMKHFKLFLFIIVVFKIKMRNVATRKKIKCLFFIYIYILLLFSI